MTADKPPVRGAPLYATENVQGTWVIKDVQNREGEDTAPEYQFAVRVGPAH